MDYKNNNVKEKEIADKVSSLPSLQNEALSEA